MKTRSRPKRTRDGRYIDDYVVEDQGEVRVPLALADGYRADLVRSFGATDTLDAHKPGFRMPDQATRDAVSLARSEMVARATSGWRPDIRRPADEDALDREGRQPGPLGTRPPGRMALAWAGQLSRPTYARRWPCRHGAIRRSRQSRTSAAERGGRSGETGPGME
jgi:hypothetical protein